MLGVKIPPCYQGGKIGTQASDTRHQVIFILPFQKTPVVMLGDCGGTSSDSYEPGLENGSVTTTGFMHIGIVRGADARNVFGYWIAYGY